MTFETEIQITDIRDWTIHGTWRGDQNEVRRMIADLPEFASSGVFYQIPVLFSGDGTEAADNTFEGTFTAGTRRSVRIEYEELEEGAEKWLHETAVTRQP